MQKNISSQKKHHKKYLMGKSLEEIYAIVGIGPFDPGTTSKEEQFRLVRVYYRKKALIKHPDKGGNPEEFRTLQTAFEYLRDHVYSDEATVLSTTRNSFEATYDTVSRKDVPSWEFYKEAPEESMPMYHFQYAASNKSTCRVCHTKIDKNMIRVGTLNEEFGTYGQFSKLHCFSWEKLFPFMNTFDFGGRKTKKKVLDCLIHMDGMYIRGITCLTTKDQTLVATLFLKALQSKRDRDEIAQTVAVKKRKSTATEVANASTELVEELPMFVVPEITEKNKDKLKGLQFTSTGKFPELGGGGGKNVGKDKLREMIESFGGIYKPNFPIMCIL